MSLVIAAPEVMSAVAADLSGIGSMLDQARMMAAGATTVIPAAAADEVSTAVAALLSGHGQQFQALSARAAVFHEDFAKTLGQSAAIYAGSEAVNAAALSSAASLPNSVSTLLDQVRDSAVDAYLWVLTRFLTALLYVGVGVLLGAFLLLYAGYRVGILSGPPGWI